MKNFLNAGWEFDDSEWELKNRFQMIVIALLLSSIAYLYGIVINILHSVDNFAIAESLLLLINIVMFFVIRKDRTSYEKISMMITALGTFLLLMIIYKSSPSDMKHVWIYTYPIVLLYFGSKRRSIYWFVFFVFMIFIAPLQSFIEVKYSLYQVFYIDFVLIIVSLIVYYYKIKMNEARDLILEQKNLLLNFNSELENKVEQKTAELQDLNQSLENKVQRKIDELIQKDKILTVQSKQAVMGEMISMIAHQWRQPLSTITLQISNMQLKKMLGHKYSDEELDKTLDDISSNIIYLSDTIEDFKTYFRPDKKPDDIEIHELVNRAVNFVAPRIKGKNIELSVQKSDNINIKTFINELVQVVLNLINNAIDALIDKDFKNPKIEVFITIKDDMLNINIKDNAAGIDDKNIGSLFEPYFSTKGRNGTGLGLYMSKMIIEKQFKGFIEYKTSTKETEHGTTFIIKIPMYLT